MDNLSPLMTISNLKKLSLIVLPLFLDSNKLRVRIPREDKRDKFLRQIPFVLLQGWKNSPESLFPFRAIRSRRYAKRQMR